MKSILKGLNYIFALLLICIAIFLAYIALPIFGNKALIVRSGSMQPAIKTGDLTVVHVKEGIISPTSDQINKYKEGDIIAFKAEKDPSVLTTHRVTSVQVRDGQIFYQTKGDANQISDKQLVAQKFVIGKSTFTVPAIGKLFAFAKTKQGFALLVLIPALLVILIESVNLAKELRKIIRARRMLRQDPESEVEKGELLGPVGLRVLMPLVVSMMFFHNSYAFFSDTASSTNNIFSAATIFPGTAGSVVINEVYYDLCLPAPSCGIEPDNEWVEIYNKSSSPIDISGWTLTDNNATVTTPSGTTIQANSFLVITPDEETWTFWPAVPVVMRVVLGSEASGKIGNGLSNTGDRLTLKNLSGITIDAISYENDTTVLNPSISPVSAGHSIERNPDGQDTNTAADFVNRTTPQPGI